MYDKTPRKYFNQQTIQFEPLFGIIHLVISRDIIIVYWHQLQHFSFHALIRVDYDLSSSNIASMAHHILILFFGDHIMD